MRSHASTLPTAVVHIGSTAPYMEKAEMTHRIEPIAAISGSDAVRGQFEPAKREKRHAKRSESDSVSDRMEKFLGVEGKAPPPE